MEPRVCRTEGFACVPGLGEGKGHRKKWKEKWTNELGWKSFLPSRKA